MRLVKCFLVLALICAFTQGVASAVVLLDPEYLGIPIGRHGGSLAVSGRSEGPKTFNPHIAAETSSTAILNQVFEGLVRLDPTSGDIVPHLARSYAISIDQTELTFHLRRGITWHDGVELTADDVIFTFDVIYNPDVPANSKTGLYIDGKPLRYEKLDKYTVRFYLPRVYAPILYSIGTSIIPEHILGEPFRQGRYTEMWTLATDPKAVVGTGPWMISRYRINQELVLVRNPNYWQLDETGNRLPYLNTVTYKYYANVDTAVSAFFNGQIDYMSIPSSYYKEFVDRQPGSRYEITSAGPDPGSFFIVLNQNPNAVAEAKYNWFTNRKFRQALAFLVDKETIIELAMGGQGFKQYSPQNVRNSFFLNGDVQKYDYNPAKAETLLEEIGFAQGSDGYRRDLEGNLIEFNLTTYTGGGLAEVVGELFQKDAQAVGIAVNFEQINFNALVDKLISTHDYDAAMIALTGTYDPNGSANTWMSGGNLHMWNPRQEFPATDWEARIDELFTAAQDTLDWEERRVYYYEWQEIVATEVPVIYTVNSLINWAVRDHLQNATPAQVDGSMTSAWTQMWIAR